MARTFMPFRNGSLVPLEDFYKEVDSLVQNFFDHDEVGPQKFSPRANLAETETGYELTLDLPGVDPNDVTVEAHDGQLTVAGERKSETEEAGKTFHRVERRFGQFRRVVSIPAPVDEEKIAANYRNGVLTVSLPKSEKLKPKRITVSTTN